jgi:hypothetical protein
MEKTKNLPVFFFILESSFVVWIKLSGIGSKPKLLL